MTQNDYLLNGIPIIITTLKTKVRHHKKRRIQKKWAKRQYTFDIQPDGQVILADGCYYMNETTFNRFKEHFTKDGVNNNDRIQTHTTLPGTE